MTLSVSRRGLLQGAAVGSAAAMGLVIYKSLDDSGTLAARDADPERFGAFLLVGKDDRVIVRIGQSEMGQGISTGLSRIVADELGAKWSDVRFEFATGDEFKHPIAYAQPPLSGEQVTGGSLSVTGFWMPLRQAAASARQLLLMAAAARWEVDVESVSAHEGIVRHEPSGRRVRFGKLVEAAAALPLPADPPLKDKSEWTLIGRPAQRMDVEDKVRGAAQFGIDVVLPDMAYATVVHAPVLGARLRELGDEDARKIEGVLDIVPFDLRDEKSGIIVVANSYWTARRAADVLHPIWTEGVRDRVSSPSVTARLSARLKRGRSVAFRNDGNVEQAFARAARRVDHEYAAPYLAHACMEPLNATAWVRGNACDVWAGTQRPSFDRETISAATGVPIENVRVHLTFLGGGFGRRGGGDFTTQAAIAAKAVGRPVKLIWSREEDIKSDHFRPAMMGRVEMGLSRSGELVGARVRIAGPGIWRQNRPVLVANDIDYLAVESLLEGYHIPAVRIDWAETEPDTRIGFWRSVGASHNVFFAETAMDEAAISCGRDPLEFRRGLLRENPRALAVLNRAAEMARWSSANAEGRHLGLAFFEAARWQTRVAQIVEVSLRNDRVVPLAVYCAFDSGLVVDPDQAQAQVQGAVCFGLSAALWGEVTLTNGVPDQSNFTDYRIVDIGSAPRIEVAIIEGADEPGSVGEIGVPAVAPALLNAVAMATGRRVRELPLSRFGLI